MTYGYCQKCGQPGLGSGVCSTCGTIITYMNMMNSMHNTMADTFGNVSLLGPPQQNGSVPAATIRNYDERNRGLYFLPITLPLYIGMVWYIYRLYKRGGIPSIAEDRSCSWGSYSYYQEDTGSCKDNITGDLYAQRKVDCIAIRSIVLLAFMSVFFYAGTFYGYMFFKPGQPTLGSSSSMN
ncbi:hypothetical protein DLAC_08562 [Tieghemostelium lacteum]|uniref:Uncharacterized protein n=1 Tax=Tieghemostelium lacteum TaxID=361077 RepID=A0A151Z7Q6_TIELA|nr:hypothetical protein DLAC_08562 [Tieghemostelium lacteum]|eukprot:KYQ89992.1 hypothetical protein DLAC_08562 [Tieghemostelium lacteum]